MPDLTGADLKLFLSQKYIVKYIASHDDIAKDPLPTCDAMIWFSRALDIENNDVLVLQQRLYGLVKLLEFDYSNVIAILQKISIN